MRIYSVQGRQKLARAFAVRQSKTILARSCEALPQPTEWQHIGNEMDGAMVFMRELTNSAKPVGAWGLDLSR
jgi:hypothetical protein